MSSLDETLADYRGSGLTTGPQIMAHLRPALAARGVVRAIDLREARDGAWVRTAGLVIVRQRPGTAKGFLFLTLEDETGMANAVVTTPSMFQRNRTLLHSSRILLVEGPLQRVEGVIHVRARRFVPLSIRETTTSENALAGAGCRCGSCGGAPKLLQRLGVAAPTTQSIRALARAGRYTLTVHAERERQADRITTSELEMALRNCEVIEHYPEDPRGHSCLGLGFANTRPVHAVCAIKDAPRELLLVTVYDPSERPEKWEAGFRRRRKS